jgi:exosome complex RNA-binding protein Rrp4
MQAEVQAVHQDGLVLLHTRSTRYGLLKNGQLIEVSPCLVKRQRQHMVNLDDYDVSIILGCNGLIWVGVNEGQSNPVNEMQFTSIARVCQTIRALAKLQIMISVDSILQATNLSLTENPVRPSGICNKEFLQMLLSGLT